MPNGPRFRRRLPWLVGGLMLALNLYVGSYLWLYRRGTAEIAGTNGFFFYVPISDIQAAKGLTRRHVALVVLYTPANDFHRRFFRAQSPCRGISCLTRPAD